MVTLRCKLKSRSGLALGPLGAPEYESRVNSRSRVPLPIFFCRSDHPEWWSLAEVHGCLDVDSPNPQIQIFRGLGAQRPLQARSFHSTVLGGTPGHMSELGAASGHLVPEISGRPPNLEGGCLDVDSPNPQIQIFRGLASGNPFTGVHGNPFTGRVVAAPAELREHPTGS